MIPDSLEFILRPVDDEQAEYAAAHQTTVPAEVGEADAGTVKSSASPDLPQGGADTDSSDADAVGELASEEAHPCGRAPHRCHEVREDGARCDRPCPHNGQHLRVTPLEMWRGER